MVTEREGRNFEFLFVFLDKIVNFQRQIGHLEVETSVFLFFQGTFGYKICPWNMFWRCSVATRLQLTTFVILISIIVTNKERTTYTRQELISLRDKNVTSCEDLHLTRNGPASAARILSARVFRKFEHLDSKDLSSLHQSCMFINSCGQTHPFGQ